MQLLTGKCVTDEAEFQVEVVRVLGSKLASSCLEIQIYNLFNGITNKVIVDGLISNFGISFLKSTSFSRSTTLWRRFALTSCCPSVSLSVEKSFQVRLLLRDQSSGPLTLVFKVVLELEEVNVGFVRASFGVSTLAEQLLPLSPVSRVNLA